MWHTIIVVGNLGKEPEMRYTPSGQAVTNFSVATSRQYTNGAGAQVKETIWFKVSAWGKLAETCAEFLHKGSKILVEGRLQPDPASGGPKTFTRRDGTAGASYDITAGTIRFLTPKGETTAEGSGHSDPDGDINESPASTEEDIPF